MVKSMSLQTRRMKNDNEIESPDSKDCNETALQLRHSERDTPEDEVVNTVCPEALREGVSIYHIFDLLLVRSALVSSGAPSCSPISLLI